jgi:hypothetical protein
VANKLDLKPAIANKKFKFADSNEIPIYFTSAANGVNVVWIFENILEKSIEYQNSPRDNFVKDVLEVMDSDSDDSN